MRPLFVAIFARNVEKFLPGYLKMIKGLTSYRQCYYYVFTNDNSDNTLKILQDWLSQMPTDSAYLDASTIDSDYSPHDWTFERLQIMGYLRKRSIDIAESMGMDYFTIDVDNVLIPGTVKALEDLNLSVVAPMIIRSGTFYANFFGGISENGYWDDAGWYDSLFNREIKGIFDVPLVHHCYLIKHENLKFGVFEDGSGRHEFVIFAESLRKAGIKMYIDNREDWGRIYEVYKEGDFENEEEASENFWTRAIERFGKQSP